MKWIVVYYSERDRNLHYLFILNRQICGYALEKKKQRKREEEIWGGIKLEKGRRGDGWALLQHPYPVLNAKSVR